MRRKIQAVGKFLSPVLRHKPEMGIVFDDQDWTDIGILLLQLNMNGYDVTHDVLDHVVTNRVFC